MGIMDSFRRKPTVEELEAKVDRSKIEREEVTIEADIEERKAVIAELKQKYGSGWMKILGVNGQSPLSSLRAFLTSARQGMTKEAGRTTGRTGMDLSRLRGENRDGSTGKLTAGGSQTPIGRVSTGASGSNVVKA